MKKALSATFVVIVSAVGCGDAKSTSNPPDTVHASSSNGATSASTTSTGATAATPGSTSATGATSAGAVNSAAADATLPEGAMAPDVEFTLEDGKKVKLSSLRGKVVAVYFYPKDDTPGCTVEAQGIRDSWDDFKKAGITVYGVSTQDAASHKDFISKQKLPYQLVVDTDGAVAKAFGVPVSGGYAARQTVLIGADGKVKKVWRSVTPKEHAKELLEAASRG